MTQNMRVSAEGIVELVQHEGIVPAPYLDSVGIWTFGIGVTAAAGDIIPEDMPKGMPDDLEAAVDYAIEVFRRTLVAYEDDVNDAVKVPLKQHEFDALVSFHYNTGGIGRASAVRALNAGEPGAANLLMNWRKPPEIIGRREQEVHLFKTGDYDANGDQIPIYSVDQRGRLGGVIKRMSGAEILRRMERPRVAKPERGSVAAQPQTDPLLLTNDDQQTYPTVRAGSPATFVKALQERLTDLGYQLGEIDGQFGPATRTSVVSFQLANDLVSDGIAGPKTWAALLEQGRAKQIDIDRRMAGLDTLRDKGSETIRHADSTRVVGGATGLLGGVAAVATASEQIEGAAGSLGASVAAVQPMLDTISSSLPLVLIAGGVAVYWLATRIQSARLNDHRSGANMGR